jgi:Secretion system C-terminal sorting domain
LTLHEFDPLESDNNLCSINRKDRIILLALQVSRLFFCTNFISMKKIIFSNFRFFVAINFVTLLLFFANTSFAQTSCPPKTAGCTDEITTTSLVSVPNFPQCVLTVEYKLWVCQGVFQVYDVKIRDFDFDQCSEWIGYILNLYFVEGEISYQSYIRKFNKAIGSQILFEIAQNVANQADPSPYYCGTGVSTITGSFYPGGCISQCIGQLPNKKLVYSQVACSGDLCCGFSTSYCIDPKTNQPIVLSGKTEQVGGACKSISITDCPKIDGVVWKLKSPCFPTCEGKGNKSTKDDESDTFVSVPLQRVSKNAGGNYVSVKLFPNPTHDYLNLFFETKFSGTVSLLNLSGQLLQNIEVSDGNFTKLDVSNQVKGTYILSFRDKNNNIVTEKIIID